MSNVILGIHGRSPKPPADQEKEWWHASLIEGLVRNERRTSDRLDKFEMAYYADIFDEPLTLDKNQEPYYRAQGSGRFETYEEGWLDRVIRATINVSDWSVEQVNRYYGLGGIVDKVLEKTMDDLATYFSNQEVRRKVQKRLIDVIDPLLGQHQIMLIAHSMGAIVAYDVIRLLGQESPRGTIKHFVTIGAPLGIPHVKLKIQEEYDLVRTPTLVERWTNLSDRRDFVALDAHLSDDFSPNSNGVRVVDDLVINGYVSPKTHVANPHKSYGYLRVPELSRLVREFI